MQLFPKAHASKLSDCKEGDFIRIRAGGRGGKLHNILFLGSENDKYDLLMLDEDHKAAPLGVFQVTSNTSVLNYGGDWTVSPIGNVVPETDGYTVFGALHLTEQGALILASGSASYPDPLLCNLESGAVVDLGSRPKVSFAFFNWEIYSTDPVLGQKVVLKTFNLEK